MIRISRGAEPPKLVGVRKSRLKTAILAFDTYGPGSKELSSTLAGYDVVKKTLYLRQHKKCAYCERKPGFVGQPVEHYRPKKLAIRSAQPRPIRDCERYWWLTWTWENLLFACTTCNCPANKGNHFPLAVGSTPLRCPARPAAGTLPAALFQTSTERPLLVDPADELIDPLDHLRWLPVERTQARSLWNWELRALTREGRETRRRLALHELADEVGTRYREVVWPRFHAEIERRLGSNRPLAAAWEKLANDLVQPTSAFTAATWSMLDVLRSSTSPLRRAALAAPPRP